VTRSTIMILVGTLQLIEAVSGLSHLDQKITQSTIDGISALHKNGELIFDLTLKVLADQLIRTSVKEYMQKIERLVKAMAQLATSLLEDLSKIQNLSEASVPESGAEHSDTEPVDALTKALVGNLSDFLRASNDGRKSELVLMTDRISDAATKLGNKIVFELKNLGISGVKKYPFLLLLFLLFFFLLFNSCFICRLDELKPDGWDLVAGKAALNKSFSSLVMDVRSPFFFFTSSFWENAP